MCEFKVIRMNDSTEIAEEILALGYSDDNKLFLSDIMGVSKVLDSALILDVNTMTQKVEIFEHPIISEFINLIKKVHSNSLKNTDIEDFKKKLNLLI
ncbi:MAG: CooT family nickel-binding protein [Promethearchaeia archaeon]